MNSMGIIKTDKGKIEVFFNKMVSVGINSKVTGTSILALSPEQAMELAELLVRAAEAVDPMVTEPEMLRILRNE